MQRLPQFFGVILFGGLVLLAGAIGVANRRHVLGQADANRAVNDFNRWMQPANGKMRGSIPAFLHERADYTNDDFPNPPIVIALFAPFTLLSPANAQLAWALCKPVMLLAIFLLAAGVVRRGAAGDSARDAPGITSAVSGELGVRDAASDGGARGAFRMALPGVWVLVLILFVWLWPVCADLAAGQTNLLMLLPLMGALRLLQSGTRGGDVWAGVLLALAISVKVTPLIFLPYLILQRRWTAAGATVAGLALWLLIVPGALFGFAQNWLWLGEWANIMLLPYINHNAVVYANNQSLPSFLARLLENIPAFSTVSGARTVAVEHYMNVMSLSPGAAGLVTRGALGAIALAGAWWMRRRLRSFRCAAYVVQVSVVAIFMLLASERTWRHHAVTLILPLLAVGAIYAGAGGRVAVRKAALWALIFAAAAFPLSTDVGKVLGRFGPLEARAWGVYLFPMLGLMGALVWAGMGFTGKARRHEVSVGNRVDG